MAERTGANDRVGIAFVGAGLVAELHARAVAACDRARFIGAYDAEPGRAKALIGRHGGRDYRSLKELVGDPSVDAVHVLTPPEGHVAAALAALRAGKHVLVEKPVAHRAADIRRLMRAAERAGRTCMPGHNYIYVPALRRAKALIDAGKLGPIAAFWMLYNLFHDADLVRKYGSVIRVVCVHHCYSLLYLLGRPERMSCMAVPGVHAPGVPDPAQTAITCQMPGGALANLWASFASVDPTNDPWLVQYKVLGTRGGVSYSWNEAVYQEDGGPGFGMPGYVDAFCYEVEYFVEQCVIGGKPPLSTLADALDALRMVEAAERSAAHGRTVTLRWEPKDEGSGSG